jgi:hypothetical protein
MGEILENVDVEGLADIEQTSFGNILLMYTYPNILAMTEAGFRDRQAFVSNRPDKFGITEWTMELELALRGENELSKVLVDQQGIKDFKYDNIFQLVNEKKAFEDVDIKIPGVAYIEVKGWLSGTFAFNKFVHMAKLYKEHGDEPLYAFARGIPYSMTKNKYNNPSQRVKQGDVNVFEKFQVEEIPKSLLKKLSEGISTLEKYSKEEQNNFMISFAKKYPEYKTYLNTEKGTVELQLPKKASVKVASSTKSKKK